MISVGIDVSKEKSTVFAADENGEVLMRVCEFEHTEAGMAELIRRLKQLPEEPRVVVENTGYCRCSSRAVSSPYPPADIWGIG